MASHDYQFVTRWRVRGTREEVFAILEDILSFPRWWPEVYLDVRQVEAAGAVPGRGAHQNGPMTELKTRGWLPYTLRWRSRLIESRPQEGFTIEASGDFVGTGAWTLVQEGDFVNIRFDWHIRADKPLLKYLSFLLKPVFAANHRWAMARGEEGLKRELVRRRGVGSQP